MNSDQVKGNWEQVKGRVKAAWGKLTDDDIREINGDRERLVGKLRERYGDSRETIGRKVDDFFSKLN
jgi:uncharacterized protein YjbJ (UPF0337 family)